MLKRTDAPNYPFCEKAQDTLFNVIGMSSAILHPPGEEGCAARDAMLQEIAEAQAAVRGNRTSAATVTWDDLRLVTAATLRVLLAHLEE